MQTVSAGSMPQLDRTVEVWGNLIRAVVLAVGLLHDQEYKAMPAVTGLVNNSKQRFWCRR